MLIGRTKVTMQYPEEKWDSQMPEHYRGAPALVRDEQRPRTLRRLSTLRIHLSSARDQDCSRRNSVRQSFRQGREIPGGIRHRHDSLHLLRDVRRSVPEQAIFLRKDYAITGFTRAEMVHDKRS